MDASILSRGAADLGISLDRTQVCQFRRYYRALIEWNAKMNLTAVTEWEQVQRRHFLDSLSLSRVIATHNLENCRFVDIGSGAGLPGIPLKIAFPGMTGVLVDSTAKRVRFLRYVIDQLKTGHVKHAPSPAQSGANCPIGADWRSGMEPAETKAGGEGELSARHGRAEALARLPDMRERFDLVVARAVAPMPVLAELTLPFCRPGGYVAVHKTSRAIDEIADARHAIDTLGGEVRDIQSAPSRAVGTGLDKSDWDGSDSGRVLVVVAKVGSTPDRYPRRPGIPAKRPLEEREVRSEE